MKIEELKKENEEAMKLKIEQIDDLNKKLNEQISLIKSYELNITEKEGLLQEM